ncbi:hypothetical protein ABN763_11850 [Spongiivirga sp. MCCC 1A20706]|uniref:hypothetical protein n=1 Tax=Spongiivirga sp. MCCC 1A20706 TaxID=3160963 RepID=UPI0039777DB9
MHIALCFVFSIGTQAQNNALEKRNELKLFSGIGTALVKDLTFSPLHYRAATVAYALQYTRKFKRSKFILELDFSNPTLQTQFSDFFETDFYTVNIELGFLRRMRGTDIFKAFTGVKLHSFTNLLFYDGTESISFFAVQTLDLAFEAAFKLTTKSNFSSAIDIPVFGLLARPAYTNWDVFILENEDNPLRILLRGDFTSLTNFFGLNWKTNYEYRISNPLAIQLQNTLRYYKTNSLRESRIVTNQLSLGLAFTF